MIVLDQIVQILHRGGIILYPTDTVWGLGCDATNAQAVERILALKNYTSTYPLEILMDSIDMLHHYVETVHPRLETLLSFHQRPLTVLYDHCRHFPQNVLSDGRAAIRVTTNPFCQEVISTFGKPILAVSPSSADSDYPTRLDHIEKSIFAKVDLVVRDRDSADDQPSVVVELNDRAELCFLRD